MASTSLTGQDQVVIDDSMVSRNRIGRTLFAAASGIAITGIPTLLGGKVAADWFTYPSVGFASGAIIGLVGFARLFDKKMLITVDSNHAFFTVDGLRSFLGRSKVYAAYGPGWHISWPWEKRESKNNVALTEASEDFEVQVITDTGTVYVNGSFRIRPRFATKDLVAFVGGVGVIAQDLSDLIKSFITENLSNESIETARKSIVPINEMLERKFARGAAGSRDPRVSAFEERFGLVVGDVTVAEIRLSEAGEKTRTGIDEATIVARGAALLLGFESDAAMREALASGKLKQSEVKEARKDFMAISENITMTHTSTDFNFRADADPELADAIRKAGPAIVLLAQQLAKNKGGNNMKGGT